MRSLWVIIAVLSVATILASSKETVGSSTGVLYGTAMPSKAEKEIASSDERSATSLGEKFGAVPLDLSLVGLQVAINHTRHACTTQHPASECHQRLANLSSYLKPLDVLCVEATKNSNNTRRIQRISSLTFRVKETISAFLSENETARKIYQTTQMQKEVVTNNIAIKTAEANTEIAVKLQQLVHALFHATLGSRNGVPAQEYWFLVQTAEEISGKYSDIMVQQCAKYDMKPVCDHKNYCRHDARAIYIGQDHHVTHESHRRNNGYFPKGWDAIKSKFKGVCTYAANHGSKRGLCHHANGHRWKQAKQHKKFMCASLKKPILVPPAASMAALSKLQIKLEQVKEAEIKEVMRLKLFQKSFSQSAKLDAGPLSKGNSDKEPVAQEQGDHKSFDNTRCAFAWNCQ